MNRVGSLIALILFMTMATFGQFDLASVVGAIKDPTGLPMPQATVEIRSLATNTVRTTTTSDKGDYDFVAIQPGRYALTAKQSGFKETTRTFEVAVGQRLQLDLSLEDAAARHLEGCPHCSSIPCQCAGD